MIEPLTDLPEGVIGFETVGEVHADDYKQRLIPALEAAAETGEVNLVFVLGDQYDGYSAGAGYDLVTGLGSPLANLVVGDLIAGTVSQPTLARGDARTVAFHITFGSLANPIVLVPTTRASWRSIPS